MNSYTRVHFAVKAEIEYKKGQKEFVPAIEPLFDENGNKIRAFYKRETFPIVLVTIGNVTKTLQEISKAWLEFGGKEFHNSGQIYTWKIDSSEESNFYVDGEFWNIIKAVEFLGYCETFLAKIFHMEI